MAKKYTNLRYILCGIIAAPILAACVGYGIGEKILMKQAEQREANRLRKLEQVQRVKSEAEIEYMQFELDSFQRKIDKENFRLSNPDLFETNYPPAIRAFERKAPTNSFPEKIEYESPKTPITEEFIERIILKESQYNPDAVSKKGARGLMQIMEGTWYEITEKFYGKRLSYDLAFHPELNREVGTNCLKHLDAILTNSLPHYEKMPIEEQQKQIAAAYNGGISRLLKKKGNINRMPKQTRDYVRFICDSS